MANYTYSYDAADRLTAKVENGTTTSYAYDATDQLTKDGSNATLAYDGTGNRTNTGYATGTGNRMSNDGTWTYTYDAADRLTAKVKFRPAGAERCSHWASASATNGCIVFAKHQR